MLAFENRFVCEFIWREAIVQKFCEFLNLTLNLVYIIVGCDVVAHVTSAGVLSDTYRGKQCELFMKKGGITRL